MTEQQQFASSSWYELYVLHNGNPETYLDVPYDQESYTRIWVTDSGIEFTAQYDFEWPDTTEIHSVRPFEKDWQLYGRCYEKKPPPFVTMKVRRRLFTVWWRRVAP